MKREDQKQEVIIKEVYFDNFETEIKKISKLIETYNYVSLDTEFPGFPYNVMGATQKEIYYKSIKMNVDKLKLIQVGITLCDANGNYPKEDNASWQFNFNFNLSCDDYSQESIVLLTNSGINFEKLAESGIYMEKFAEYLISSGLVLNDDIKWISFHGAYDFAYLLKILTNQPLPENENLFFEQLKEYFPNYFDVRFLVKNDNFRGSLSKLAQELEINRIGTQHQAGSDSVVTSEIFFKLKKNIQFDSLLEKGKNVLFGLGTGSDDNENINFNQQYYGFNNKTYNNLNNNMNNFQKNNFNNFGIDPMYMGQMNYQPFYNNGNNSIYRSNFNPISNGFGNYNNYNNTLINNNNSNFTPQINQNNEIGSKISK